MGEGLVSVFSKSPEESHIALNQDWTVQLLDCAAFELMKDSVGDIGLYDYQEEDEDEDEDE
jgi:hypothetical protein